MNVLILSWRAPGHPNAGGAEQTTLEHAKAWSHAGHQVTWFSSFFPGAEKKESIRGINVIRRGSSFFGVHVLAMLWCLFGEHDKFDLVVDEIHGIPFFTPLYVKVTKLAYIHEVAKEVWLYNPWPKPLNVLPATIGRFLEPFIFRFIYKNTPFMTVSESTKNDLISWGIPKTSITVIHNGVSLSLPKVLPKKETIFTALYLGAISADKGVYDAMSSFGEISKRDEDWQFWIAGKGVPEYISKLKDQARKLKIDNKVKFWGFVSDQRKFELMARAHVLVNPSIREGWGLVNLEANSVGTPVVGYDVAGMRDSVKNGKTGVLVAPRDYRALAQELLELVRSNERYAGFQKKAIKWSKNFKWEKSTKESLQLVESL